MYQVSTNFNSYAFAQSREISLKLFINDNVNVTATDIISMSVEQVITDGDSATLGHSMSAILHVKVRNVNVAWSGAKIKAWIGITNPSNVVEWCPMGVFFVSSYATVDDFGTSELTAYDSMAFLDMAYTPSVTMPATLSAVVTDISTITGLAVETTIFPNRTIDNIYDNGGNIVVQTIRDTLAYVAGLMGANAVMSRDGKIEFRKFTTQSITIGTAVQYLSEFSRQQTTGYTFGKLVSGTEEAQITSGTTGHAISYVNPFMTQAILDAIRTDVLPITVMTGTIRYRGDPQLDVGDIVTVTDSDNTSWSFLISENKISVEGGMSATISCNGMTDEQVTLTQVGNTALKNLIREQATVAVKYISADNITAGTIGADVIFGGTINGSQINAGTVNADRLNASSMSAVYANVDLLNTTMVGGEAIVTSTGYINNATITDLTVNKLRLQGLNGLYYEINVAGGAITPTEAQSDLNTYGTQIAGQTLIDGTVTAEKIYVTDLYALNALIAGLHIGSGQNGIPLAIYSGNKTSVDTGTGLYMDSTGQLGLVGANGYLKFYDDNGVRKLAIVADSLYLGSTSVGDLEYSVEIRISAIDYDQNTATLVAIPYKNGTAQTASSYTYAWTKIAKNGTRTALTGTSSSINVTDLDATYEVKLN